MPIPKRFKNFCWTSYRFFMFIIVSNLERFLPRFSSKWWNFPIALRINKYDQLLFFTIGTCIASFWGFVVDRFPNHLFPASQSLWSLPARLWRLGSHPPLSRNYPSFSLPLLSSDLPIFGVLPLRFEPALGLCQWFSFSASPSNTTEQLF